MDPPPNELLDIIIRFASSSHPDLPLQVDHPQLTSISTLKLQIRKTLSIATHINLIHAGKLLRNNESVASVLATTRRRNGKTPVYRDGEQDEEMASLVYIHCAFGEALTTEEANLEEQNAITFDKALHDAIIPTTRTNSHEIHPSSPPQGFDRLASTGWTQSDITTLRASFLAQLSHTHTPSSLPSGSALRLLEDRWLDATGPETQGLGIEEDESAAMEDTLWGSLLGFFWPWAAVWSWREEGIWTERRQMMVVAGVAMNVVFGFMRLVTRREDGIQ